ncbi:hypothetical protein ACGRWF_05615 [Lacticaseibacillus paracasei]|uniref:hypothetical protein n=1 Tax=Lacticaseibacillus paracasei TaxID=1597 RepID=UPI00384F2DBA
MMNFENDALPQKGYVASSVILTGPVDGIYTITAKQVKHGKPDRTMTMQFTHNGLAAIVGCWLAALGEAEK